MRRTVWGIAIATGLLGQTAPGLPFEGVVVDEEGKPVAAVEIYGVRTRKDIPKTASDGWFKVDPIAPVIVLRKPGVRSQRVATSEKPPVRITVLREAVRPYPRCQGGTPSLGIEGFGGRLRFRSAPGLDVSGQSNDVDYGYRRYAVRRSKSAIGHGSGPMWSLGLPRDEDVGKSTTFEETLYSIEGLPADNFFGLLKDSRGQLADGTYWRQVGLFGETARYAGVDRAAAETLDQVLDSGCYQR